MDKLSFLASVTLVITCSACVQREAPREVALDVLESEVGYPHATWHADPASINDVRLSLSHILVAHEGARSSPLDLTLIVGNRRSRADALRLASTTAKRLAAHPEEFDSLAKQLSDDRATKPFGGNMGVVAATNLPPSLVDALAALKDNQLSRVVESEQGFHIVKRLPVPALQRVEGRRIVISHRDVAMMLRPDSVTRTREQALELAQHLATLLRENPTDFPKLVTQYSDDHSAPSNGDLGVLSTHNGGSFSGFFAGLLASAAVGEVIGPIEMQIGFVMLQRTPETRHETLAMRYIDVRVVDSVPPGLPWLKKRSAPEAETLATQLTAELARDGRQFEAVQQRTCETPDCSHDVMRWEQSTQPEFDAAVVALAIGQIGMLRLADGSGFKVIRREDPTMVPASEEHYTYEIPQVKLVPFNEALVRLDGPTLAQGTRELLETAVTSLALEPSQQKALRALLEPLATTLETAAPAERPVLIEDNWQALTSLLGPEKIVQFQRMREARWQAYQMRE